MVDKILDTLMYVILIVMAFALFWTITMPLWSEKRDVCLYWENNDGNMRCIKRTTEWCFGKCDEVENEKH